MSIASKLAELVIKKGGTLSADEDSVEEILAKLIELEDGEPSGGGVLLISGTYTDECIRLNKTYNEIKAAFLSGSAVFEDARFPGEEIYYWCTYVGAPEGYYMVQFGSNYEFHADSEDSYPFYE